MEHVPFQKLIIWDRAMKIAKKLYVLTGKFPAGERYGLSSQLRRAAVSVPSNIAEGCQKRTDRDFLKFLRIAEGSLAEIETQIILSYEFGYFDSAQNADIMNDIHALSKMLRSFIATLTTRSTL